MPPNKGLQPTRHSGGHRAAPGARPSAPRLKPMAFGGRGSCQGGPDRRLLDGHLSRERIRSHQPRTEAPLRRYEESLVADRVRVLRGRRRISRLPDALYSGEEAEKLPPRAV